MTLAALHLLASIESTIATHFGRLDALAIDDDNRGRRRAAFFLAHGHRQNRQNLIEKAAIPPAVEPVLNGRKWRKILRKQTPLTARSNLVEYCIQNCPKRMSTAATFFRTREQWLQKGEFLIRQIRCILRRFCLIQKAVGFGPRHFLIPR